MGGSEVQADGMEMAGDLSGTHAAGEALPPLSLTAMETLLASLDPLLDGFGEGPSCLDDARAYLDRLASGGDGLGETATLVEWIERWRAADGNRQTLRLMVQTLIRERSESREHEKGASSE